MRRLALLMVGLLAACSQSPSPTTAQGRCEQQADQDPAVKALITEAPLRSGDVVWQSQIAAARRTAVYACLNAQGLAPAGGVQPVHTVEYGSGAY
jgi:hypothetical protein